MLEPMPLGACHGLSVVPQSRLLVGGGEVSWSVGARVKICGDSSV
jgi:hypothetical protein